jgi:hypothetical protein
MYVLYAVEYQIQTRSLYHCNFFSKRVNDEDFEVLAYKGVWPAYKPELDKNYASFVVFSDHF